MRKLWFLPVLLLVIIPLAAGFSCGLAAEVSQTSSVIGQPVDEHPYGGILRIISAREPVMLGYAPLMGPEDAARITPGVERLMDTAADRTQGNGLEPVLAERVDEDIANKRIVFHLRPNVRFQDGTSLDADVVIWNFRQVLDSGALQFADRFKDIKKLDDFTVEIDYTEYSNQLIYAWGILGICSRDAWEKASGGDLQKGIDWARSHVVGTGPFILQEFRHGDKMIWVKNPDYWQEGKPYLDGIEVNFIPDDSTARAVMLAGEADYWEYSYSLELEEQGFDIWRSWAGLVINLWPNTADPDSKWNDIQLRQALEYAIDKKAICEAFGLQTFKPMYMVAPPGEWGYDPEYPVREFDPVKARQLVIDAGYPDGLDATLLIQANYESQVTGSILKNCLDAIGIRVELDLADEGRYFSAVFGNAPVSDLLMMYSGTDINWLVSYMRWFSTEPIINVSYLGHTDEQRVMDEQALSIQDPAGQKAITEKLVKYLTDNAIVIPIFWFGMRQVVASYVHGPQPQTITWHTEELWMEEH